MSALKRVEAFCDSGWFTKDSSVRWEISEGVWLSVQDLFAVLALAKESAELKRKMRAASVAVLKECWDTNNPYVDDYPGERARAAEHRKTCADCAAYAKILKRKPPPKTRRR